MSLFSKKIMTATITFYGENMAIVDSVTAIADRETKEQILAELFIRYYAKILFNLGKGGIADSLISYIDKVIEQFNLSRPFAQDRDGKLAIIISGINRINILPSDMELNPTTEKIDNYLEGIAEKSLVTNRDLGSVATELIKKYEAELFEKSRDLKYAQTNMSRGGEEYYAPLSVVVFLQNIINDISLENLAYFMIVLISENKYFKEIKEYSDIRSTAEAPEYAFELAAQRFA